MNDVELRVWKFLATRCRGRTSAAKSKEARATLRSDFGLDLTNRQLIEACRALRIKHRLPAISDQCGLFAAASLDDVRAYKARIIARTRGTADNIAALEKIEERMNATQGSLFGV